MLEILDFGLSNWHVKGSFFWGKKVHSEALDLINIMG